jgi:hypothetical protein
VQFHNCSFEDSGCDIFVFGSNLAGRHGRGAAKDALVYGAKYGKGLGISGSTYAIPTKDANIQTLGLDAICYFVEEFLEHASTSPHSFYLTRIGCGLAGYKDSQIAPLFSRAPLNVVIPIQWKELYE